MEAETLRSETVTQTLDQSSGVLPFGKCRFQQEGKRSSDRSMLPSNCALVNRSFATTRSHEAIAWRNVRQSPRFRMRPKELGATSVPGPHPHVARQCGQCASVITGDPAGEKRIDPPDPRAIGADANSSRQSDGSIPKRQREWRGLKISSRSSALAPVVSLHQLADFGRSGLRGAE